MDELDARPGPGGGTQEAVERVGELVAALLGRGGGLMVVKVAGVGRSFTGVASYCLHDRREPGEPQPETDEQVEWTDTRRGAH